MQSTWELVKEYINTHDVITRKKLHEVIHNGGNTLDQYINLIRNAGFIQRTKRGQYIKLSNIPDYIKSNSILMLAYNDEERLKFFRREKIKKLNEY